MAAARPHECVVREGRNLRVTPGAGRALLPPGRTLDGWAASTCADKAEKRRGGSSKAKGAIEVGVQASNEGDDGSAGAMLSCLMCGRAAECSMADLNDSDKGQIAAVLKQVLELSELNDSMSSQLAAEETARKQALDQAAALTGEVDGLRGKLRQALDLLRAYQKRVREMQQALVASDQALIALQSEHKALLVRIPGARGAPPTPPPRVNSGHEQGSGDLSAAVDSIAAALATEADVLHTPRENAHGTAVTGQEPSAPGTQENTPAPQRPAPTPHQPDESTPALHRMADASATGPGVQSALPDQQSNVVRLQAWEQEVAAAATNGMPGRRENENDHHSAPTAHEAAKATAEPSLDSIHDLSSTCELSKVQPEFISMDAPSPQIEEHRHGKGSTLGREKTEEKRSDSAREEPAGHELAAKQELATNIEKSGGATCRDGEGAPSVLQAGLPLAGGASGASRRSLAFGEGSAAGALHKDAGKYVAAVRVDISSSSSSEEGGEDEVTCPRPIIRVEEPKLVSFAPQARAASAWPALEQHPAHESASAHAHAHANSTSSSEEEAAGHARPAETKLDELPAPELELLSLLVENALSTSRDKSMSPGKSHTHAHSSEEVAARSPSKTRRGRTRVKTAPKRGAAPAEHNSSSASPAPRKGSPAARAEAPKRGRGQRASPSKKEKLLQTRIRIGGRSPSKSGDVKRRSRSGAEMGNGNNTMEALLAPPQQEKINGAEEFYDDSLFRLVDMLDEVTFDPICASLPRDAVP